MYFRSMTPAPDGLPEVGRSGRTLGVRIPRDITPDETGLVWPGQGGMSVAPDSPWSLPHHRRPRGMGRGSTGPGDDRVFSLAPEALVTHGLVARRDPGAPVVHALVEPARGVRLDEFERSLAATRPCWDQAWP